MPYILSQKLPYIKPTLKRSVNINPLKMSYILNQKIPYRTPGILGHTHTQRLYIRATHGGSRTTLKLYKKLKKLKKKLYKLSPHT